MVHPGELIGKSGQALIAGRLEAIAATYCYPFVVTLDGEQHVLRDPCEIIEILSVFREDLLRQNIVAAHTNVESQVIFNDDMAFLNAHTVFLDASGAEVTDSRTSYVLRKTFERWEIITISIDKKAHHAPGACLLEKEAA